MQPFLVFWSIIPKKYQRYCSNVFLFLIKTKAYTKQVVTKIDEQVHTHIPPLVFCSALGIFKGSIGGHGVCTLALWKAQQPEAMQWAVWSIMTWLCKTKKWNREWGKEQTCRYIFIHLFSYFQLKSQSGNTQGSKWQNLMKSLTEEKNLSCLWQSVTVKIYSDMQRLSCQLNAFNLISFN